MQEYDDTVLSRFLKDQGQLFPEPVAQTLEEAEAFLEEVMAVVVNSAKEVWQYFEEQGIDIEGVSEEELLLAEEIFDLKDGRYLIVEG